MRIIATLLDIAFTFNEGFWLIQWVDIFADKRSFWTDGAGRRKHIVWIFLAIFIAIIFGLNHMVLTSPYTMIIIMLFSIAAVFCIWKRNFMECIAIVGGYFFCMFLKGNIEIWLTGIIGQETLIQQTTAEKGIIRIIYLLISGGLWFLLNKYTTDYFRNKSIRIHDVRYIAGIAIVGFIGCAFIGAIMLQSFNIQINALWGTFLILLLLAIAVFYFILKQKDERLRTTVLQAKNEMLEKNYIQVNEFYTANAKLYHDMNHHFDAIYHMLQQGQIEQAKEYIESIRSQSKLENYEIQTGINVLDAILYEMQQKAKKKNILLKVETPLLPGDIGIEKKDICSLFANLLENAIEAATKEIMLQIKSVNKAMFVCVKNDFDLEPVSKDGRFVTNKKDKDLHGWGTQIIEQIVQKYEGDIQYETEDKLFVVQLMLNEK